MKETFSCHRRLITDAEKWDDNVEWNWKSRIFTLFLKQHFIFNLISLLFKMQRKGTTITLKVKISHWLSCSCVFSLGHANLFSLSAIRLSCLKPPSLCYSGYVRHLSTHYWFPDCVIRCIIIILASPVLHHWIVALTLEIDSQIHTSYITCVSARIFDLIWLYNYSY